jgi:hypothetical protein
MIENFYKLTYKEYVAFLLEKYGPAVCDYFANEQCKSKSSKISRTKEGLFCHHIDENKEILLSTPEVARLHPFEYQKKEHLVYCNIIEHLLLHVKIVQECSKDNPSLGVGGVSMITAQINGYYDNPPTSGWQINAYNVIKDNYDDYINLLAYTVAVFQNAENIFGFQVEDFCKNWDGQLIESIHQDLSNELQINSCKNNRLYIGDKVIASKIGHGIIIAMLLPEGYDEPVMIIENSNGERQPLIATDTHLLKVVERIQHKHTLYPGDGIVDNKYGNGVIKDVVLREDGIIITVLYDKYFCVYFDEICNENLIEAKRINSKYK